MTGLPRAQTFKRQQSELRTELEPVLEPVQPTRTVSMDRSLLRWPPTPEEMPHDELLHGPDTVSLTTSRYDTMMLLRSIGDNWGQMGLLFAFSRI